MLRRGVLGAIAGLVLGVAASPAGAASLDQVSSTRYVADATAVVEAGTAAAPAERVAANAVVDGVASGCPGVLATDPAHTSPDQQRTLADFGQAAGYELSVTFLVTSRPAFATFAGQVARLRWTSRSAARAVAALADGLRRALALAPPKLCDLAGTAAGTGFARPPPALDRFLRAADRAFRSSATIDGPLKLMKPFATRAHAPAIDNLRRVEKHLQSVDGAIFGSAMVRLDQALTGT